MPRPILAEVAIKGVLVDPFISGMGLAVTVIIYLILALTGLVILISPVLAARSEPVNWKAYLEPIQRRAWPWRDGIVLLLLLLGMQIVLLSVFAWTHRGQDPGTKVAVLWLGLQSLVVHWFILGFVAAYLYRRKCSWLSAFGNRARTWGHDVRMGLIYYLATLPVLLLYSALYEVWLRMTGGVHTPQDVVEILGEVDSVGWVSYFGLLAIVLAPVAEEILFRGIALPVLARRFGMVPAVLTVSAAFAAVHGHLSSMVPLFAIALAFSLAYIRTGSLLVPIVMHSVFNSVNLCMLLMMKYA